MESAGETAYKPWFAFKKQQTPNIPVDLEDQVWENIQINERRKRIKIYGSFLAAASVCLLISLFIFNKPQAEMSLAEKTAVLKEALAMSPSVATQQEVIYEDNIIIIYTEKENNHE
tara:strand:+ start:194 stop:541 length:348 start_codon:yes stop_codon:yes gene_type:complete